MSRTLSAALLSSFILSSVAFAQTLPGGSPQDVSDAVSHPQEYAWRLFLAPNRQANPTTRGEFDPSKPTPFRVLSTSQ